MLKIVITVQINLWRKAEVIFSVPYFPVFFLKEKKEQLNI